MGARFPSAYTEKQMSKFGNIDNRVEIATLIDVITIVSKNASVSPGTMPAISAKQSVHEASGSTDSRTSYTTFPETVIKNTTPRNKYISETACTTPKNFPSKN